LAEIFTTFLKLKNFSLQYGAICDKIGVLIFESEELIMRVGFTLRCEVCKEENYISKKNKRNTPDRIEANKYCPRCRKSTAHKEKK